MGNPLDSAQFVRLLDKRLRQVEENKFKDLSKTAMIPKFYNEINSDSAWEEFLQIGMVPDIPEFTGRVSYLPISPGFVFRIEPKEYSGGLQFERKLIEDKKYAVLDDRAEGLMVSAHRVREKSGVRQFAYAFSSAFDFMQSEEGLSLCNTAHLTKSGAPTTTGFSNSGTTSLTKTGVQATRVLMRQFRSDIGERIEISDNLALVVPDNLADYAHELAGTPKMMDTSEGNINVNYGRYEVIPYLRLDDYSSNAWFMVDKDAMKKDLVWINRIKPEVKHTVDFETYQLKAALYMRYAAGWKDWRWIYGMNL